MSIFEKSKKSKKFVVRPRLWKILLSRVAVLLLVGVVVIGVIANYYTREVDAYIEESTDEYINDLEFLAQALEINPNLAHSSIDMESYIALAPSMTGKFACLYKDGKLISETKPCVLLSISPVNVPANWESYGDSIPLTYVIDVDKLDFNKYGLDKGFDSRRMHILDTPINDVEMSELSNWGFHLLNGSTTIDEINKEFDLGINLDDHPGYSGKVSLSVEVLNYDRTPTEKDFEAGFVHSFPIEMSVPNSFPYHSFELVLSRNVYMRNSFDNMGIVMYLIVAFVLVVCILVGCIWAIIRYFSLKNMYSVYLYRSNITNKLAHDLKTPLMAIASMAETYKGSSNPEKKDHYVNTIAENARYMDSLITQTLELASSESGDVKLDKESFDIKGLVDEVCALLESKISANKLKIDMSSLESKTINSDRLRLKNVITCLMDNAVKYAPEGSIVVVGNSGAAGRAAGGSVGGTTGGTVSGSCVVSITNEYKGKIDNVKTLTEPFVRGDKSRSTKGSGLGLAIADRELKNLGFDLSLKADGGKFTAVVK